MTRILNSFRMEKSKVKGRSSWHLEPWEITSQLWHFLDIDPCQAILPPCSHFFFK